MALFYFALTQVLEKLTFHKRCVEWKILYSSLGYLFTKWVWTAFDV